MNRQLAPALQTESSATLPWSVFGISSTAVFLVSIDVTVLYAAFPALRVALSEASLAQLSWVLNAYTLLFAALLVPAGRFADLRGRKRIFLLGLSLFLGASLACGLAANVTTLIVMRALQGAGAALLLPASLSILLAAFPANKRTLVLGLWGAVSAIAAALGPSLGSFLVDRCGWSWAFFLNLPPGVLALWLGWRWLDESRDLERGAPIDIPGVLLLILGVGAITFGLVKSESAGWSSPEVLLAISGGLLSLRGFISWARKARVPAIDLTLFQDKTYRYINIASLFFAAGFTMMFFQTFLFTTSVWSYSLSQAGLAASPGPLIVVPTAIISSRYAASAGHKFLLVIGSLISVMASIWFVLMPTTTPDYLYSWLPGAILTGLGVGMVMPSLSASAVAHLHPSRFGVGAAVNQAVRQIGAVLGVALTVTIAGHSSFQLTQLHTLCYWQIILALLTALICTQLPKHATEH